MSATYPTAVIRDDEIALPDGPRLALRRAGDDGLSGRPFVLVHGLASNARLWDQVARELAAAAHPVVAVDLRGHGRSEQVDDGYTTGQAAEDLAALVVELGYTGARRPVMAGQSWGGNVVLEQAARHGGVAAVACLDGGWLRPRDRFGTFEECWRVLAPPKFTGMTHSGIRAKLRAMHPDWSGEALEATLANLVERPDGTVTSRLTREHHRQILQSLWDGDPRATYPRVAVPVLLLPVAPSARDLADDPLVAERATTAQHAVTEALSLLPDARARWYAGADHDVHAQQPHRVATDLLSLLSRAEERHPE